MKSKVRLLMAAATFLVVTAIIMSVFSGCAQVQDWFNKAGEDFSGRAFTITEYDQMGNKTLSIHGDSVAVGLLENDANIDSEASGFKSEVLEITVDKKQMFQVGNTCIIAEDGLDMVTDFSDEEMDIEAGDGKMSLMFADRLINKWRNAIGRPMTVVVMSQMGVPIGIYQGDKVYVTVPDDLPKTTRITIDGKSLYVHRAAYTILESDTLSE